MDVDSQYFLPFVLGALVTIAVINAHLLAK